MIFMRIAALSHGLQDYLETRFGTKLVEEEIYNILDSLSDKLIDFIHRSINQNIPEKGRKDPLKIRQEAEIMLYDEIADSIVNNVFINPQDTVLKSIGRNLEKELKSVTNKKLREDVKGEAPSTPTEYSKEITNIIKKHIKPFDIETVAKEIITSMNRISSAKKIASTYETQEKIRVIAAKIAAS